MSKAVRTYIACGTLIATIALGGYYAVSPAVSAVWGALQYSNPMVALQRDRAFMNVPPGAELRDGQSMCDSGELYFSRQLTVGQTNRSVRGEYERGLTQAGWTATRSHHYARRMADGRHLYVVIETHKHDTVVTIDASVDAPDAWNGDC